MNLNKREIAHILAALRIAQKQDLNGMAHFEEIEPLTLEEVDALCEKVNLDSAIRTTEIIISEGTVQYVHMDPGIRVVIKDYDVEGRDSDDFDIREDEQGDSYFHQEYLNDDDPD